MTRQVATNLQKMLEISDHNQPHADEGIPPFAARSIAAMLGVDGSLITAVLSGAGQACRRCQTSILGPGELTHAELNADESILAIGIWCETIPAADREILASAVEARYAVASDNTLASAETVVDPGTKALILRSFAKAEVQASGGEYAEILRRMSQELAVFAGKGRSFPMRTIGSLSARGICVFCSGDTAIPTLSDFRSRSKVIACATCKGREITPTGCRDCLGTGLAAGVRQIRSGEIELGDLPGWTANSLMTDPLSQAPETLLRFKTLVDAGFGDYPIGFLTDWFSSAEHVHAVRMVRKATGEVSPANDETNDALPAPPFPTVGYHEVPQTGEHDFGGSWIETDAVGALPRIRIPLSISGMTFLVGPPSSGKSQIVRDLVPRLFRRRKQEMLRASFSGIGKLVSPTGRPAKETSLGIMTGLWMMAAEQFAGLPESRQAGFTERSFIPEFSELPCPDCGRHDVSAACSVCSGTGLDPALIFLRSDGVDLGECLTRRVDSLGQVRWMGEHAVLLSDVLARLGLGHMRLIDPIPGSTEVAPEILSLLKAVLDLPVPGRNTTSVPRRTLVVVDGLLDAVRIASHYEILRDVFDYITNHGGSVLSASRVFPAVFHSCPDHVITLSPASKLRTPVEMRDRLYPPHLSEVRIWTAN